jgi:glycogen operon protein
LRRGWFFDGSVNERGLADVTWHGTKLGSPGWSDPNARALAMTLAGFNGDPDLHVMLNMHWGSLDFEVPEVEGRRWFKAVDTAAPGGEIEAPESTIAVQGRSVVVLVNRARG